MYPFALFRCYRPRWGSRPDRPLKRGRAVGSAMKCVGFAESEPDLGAAAVVVAAVVVAVVVAGVLGVPGVLRPIG